MEIFDPLQRAIRNDLRQLRRAMNPFTAADVADCAMLVTHLGMGSAAQAFSALLALKSRYGLDEDGDIVAFFETCGHELAGDTLDARLANYAGLHNVDPRTGLRRSDRGVERLSHLIRDGLQFERPWGNVIVAQSSNHVEGLVRINVESGTATTNPRIWIVGRELEQLQWRFEQSDFGSDMLSATIPLPKTELRVDFESETTLFDLRIVWTMPVWPQWYVGAQLADARLVAVLSTNRNFETTVTLNWAYPPDDAKRGRTPLANLGGGNGDTGPN